jgi:hypothetical protein
MPPNILPSPSDFSAGHFAGWFFTLYAGLLVVSIALIWALWTGFKNHNWLPSDADLRRLPVLTVGANDLLGHLRWANDLPF